ncbi:MAG: hypothetical protein U1E65_13875 [Myxococcota bacterium]
MVDPRRVAGVLLPLLVVAAPAQAVELSWYTEHRFFGESIPLEVLATRLRATETATGASSRAVYQGHLVLGLRGRPTDALGLRFGLDSGLVEIGSAGVYADGRSFGDQAKKTLFLGETYFDLELGETGVVEIRGGKRITRVGDGVLFDAYAFGLDLDVDLSLVEADNPIRVHADALLPDTTFTAAGKTSPLFALQVDLVSNPLDVWVLGAAFVDGDDDLALIVTDAAFRGKYGQLCTLVARRRGLPSVCDGSALTVGTRGALGWAGVGLRLSEERWDLSASGYLGLGSTAATFRLPGAVRAVDAEIRYLSGLGALSANLRPTEALRLGAFGLVVSGDDGFSTLATTQTHHGFVSLSPRLGYTRIFFNGGLSSSLQSITVSSVSPDGAGLVSGGLNLSWGISEDLVVRATGALMASLFPSPSTGTHLLGGETDLSLEYFFTPELSARAEGAVFLPGSYYGEIQSGFQIVAGLIWAHGA